jgi:hypothetical protein
LYRRLLPRGIFFRRIPTRRILTVAGLVTGFFAGLITRFFTGLVTGFLTRRIFARRFFTRWFSTRRILDRRFLNRRFLDRRLFNRRFLNRWFLDRWILVRVRRGVNPYLQLHRTQLYAQSQTGFFTRFLRLRRVGKSDRSRQKSGAEKQDKGSKQRFPLQPLNYLLALWAAPEQPAEK